MERKREGKVGKVMGEFKRGTLHSGSPQGPVVKSHAQAVAIGLSEARAAGEKVKPPPRKEAKRAKPFLLNRRKG